MDPLRFNTFRTPGVGTPAAPAPFAPAAQQAPAAPGDQVSLGSTKSSLLDKAKTVSMAGAGGIVGSALLYTAGAVGLATAVGAGAGLVALAATGMAAIHLGKKLFHRPDAGQQQQAAPRTLLSTARNAALVSSVGISAAGILSAGGVAAGVAALGVVGGGAALVAVGLAAVHLGKKFFNRQQAPPQIAAPPPQAAPLPQQAAAQPVVAPPAEVQRFQSAPGLTFPPGFGEQ